jgi:signal transduction histidine kinase/CheY-like chemotaxis protein
MGLFDRFSLSSIILVTVGVVLSSTIVPITALQIRNEHNEIRKASERQAIAALDMLESVHANAMLFRKQTQDNDPAIDTLNGTMEQFSEQSANVKLWLVMDQKVIDYQLANNQNEVEGPLDSVDEKALETGQTQAEFFGVSKFRITRPVILGEGSAADEKCAACHNGLMNIAVGDPIGAYSAEVDMSAAYAAWKQSSTRAGGGVLILILLTLGIIYLLLKRTVLNPVEDLARAADKIANGEEQVVFTGEERPDSLGVLARSLNVFKDKTKENLKLELAANQSMEVARAAEAAERAKSEFLANMSHEIRTPMNGVMGMAELLSKTELNSKQKMFTDIITKSGAALLTIINDILDFSKIDAGMLQLDPAPFNLREAIEDTATLVSARASEKDLELAVRVAPDVPNILIGDSGRLRQIFTNLLGNAVKFTDQGHVVAEISLDGEITKGENPVARICFQVIDTGVGVPLDKQATIFEKFSQVDGTTTRKHEGTGLGLAISSSLVELMGSKISVKSDGQFGSTFSFTLELPVSGESTRKLQVPGDLGGKRILIVDDNAVNRSILIEQMSSWNFDCAAVVSGNEALKFLKTAAEMNFTIDAIVLDYHMPEMNGGVVLKAIRSDRHWSRIPVIMLTSVDQLDNGRSFSTLEIQGHLTKPARSSLLLEMIIDSLSESMHPPVSTRFESVSRTDLTASTSEDCTNKASGIEVAGSGGMAGRAKGRLDVLVAEDNPVNQILMEQCLLDGGYTFEIANDGFGVVEKYKLTNPKIILMDVSMPNCNGIEATRIIRELESQTGIHVPIIGVTAHALKGDREKFIESGMDDYISKPISPNHLQKKISKWLDTPAKPALSA